MQTDPKKTNKKMQVSMHTDNDPHKQHGLTKSSVLTHSTTPGMVNNPDFNEVFSSNMQPQPDDDKSQDLRVSSNAGISERDMHNKSAMEAAQKQGEASDKKVNAEPLCSPIAEVEAEEHQSPRHTAKHSQRLPHE